MSDLQSDLFVSTPIIEQKRISVTADWWDDIHAEMAKISKLNSDYKHQIHQLRQRCEALVREMEGLRAARSATPVVRHFDGINQEPQQED